MRRKLLKLMVGYIFYSICFLCEIKALCFYPILWCEVRYEKVLSKTRLAAFFWTSKDFSLLAIGIKYEWRKLHFTLFCRHYWASDCSETIIKCHIPNLLNLQTMPAAPTRPLGRSDDAMRWASDSGCFWHPWLSMTIRDTRVQRCTVKGEHFNRKV